MDTLHEDQYTFFIIYRSVLLGMRTFSGKVVQKIKTQIMFNKFFSKILPCVR